MLTWLLLITLAACRPFQFVNYEQILRSQTLEVYEDISTHWNRYTHLIDQVNTH